MRRGDMRNSRAQKMAHSGHQRQRIVTAREPHVEGDLPTNFRSVRESQ